jgi:hypothetical protein
MAGAGDGYLQKDVHTQGERSAGCGAANGERAAYGALHCSPATLFCLGLGNRRFHHDGAFHGHTVFEGGTPT